MCHNQTTINSSPPSAAYMCRWIGTALVQMAARLFGPKPLSKPMLGYCQLDQIQNFSTFHSRKCIWRGGEGLGKHRSGSTVVPDSTKPLHEPMVNFHPWVSVPDSKVHGTNMGPIRGRQNPCWPHDLCDLGWHSPESNFTASAQATILYNKVEKSYF